MKKFFLILKLTVFQEKEIDFNDYKNKVILFVNTASYCGFTKQYDDLQKLWDKYKKDGLIVLGIPSNSFNQEKKDNNEVKEFCEVNFNINFPCQLIMMLKEIMLMKYLNGQKKIMVNLLYQNGIFIKF